MRRLIPQVFPELLDPGKEAFGLRVGAGGSGGLEAAQKIALFVGQIDGGLHRRLHEEVTGAAGAQHRHPLPRKRKRWPV